MALGIRSIRDVGRADDVRLALLREVLDQGAALRRRWARHVGLAPLLDVLWPLWDEENRALHDFIVDTRVVQGLGDRRRAGGGALRGPPPRSR